MDPYARALSLLLLVLTGCSLKGLAKAQEDAGATAAVVGADAGATAEGTAGTATPATEQATNAGDLARFPAEKPLGGAAATVKSAKAVVQTAPGAGTTVATLKAGDTVTLVTELDKFDRVLLASPKEPSKKLGGWIAKSAFDEPTKSAKAGVPTCVPGQVMGSEALSPLKPFCGAKCKTDADCKGVVCMTVNELGPDGAPAKSGAYIKLCNANEPVAAGAAPSASAAAKPVATKCKPSEHFDDINKKCRPLGDCPKGYHWVDPMQSCVMDE